MPHTQLESSRFHHRLRVRWAEVDMRGDREVILHVQASAKDFYIEMVRTKLL